MTKHERSSLAPAHNRNRNPGMRTGSETSENAERPTSNVEGREGGTEDRGQNESAIRLRIGTKNRLVVQQVSP